MCNIFKTKSKASHFTRYLYVILLVKPNTVTVLH